MPEWCADVEQLTGSQTQFLVVMGTSAGDLESVTAIVERLPDDFDAPVVIGMHVNPARASQLQSTLSERTSLPVVNLEDRTRLDPGTIYVVPANHNVQIQDGHVLLTSDNPGSQPSVDLLFRSAAEAYSENLVAVVLSGTGSDGSIGARFVKAHGGTVIVQNPEMASSPGLPLSLSLSDVDLTANVERIPALLTEFVRGGFAVPAASEHSALRSFLEDLRDESGIDFTTYRQTTIQRRIQRRMAAMGTTSFPEYLRLVRRNDDERHQLVKSFLISVTEFFRDGDLFDYLRDHVLPELIRDAASREGELRIWSAGCSTGEEAYSLAIVVHEALKESGSRVNARIFATDLDEDAVAFARQGIFPARAFANLPRDVVERNFMPLGDEFEIRKHIRSMVVFGVHDVARRAPFPRTDLILCRNVLVYFTLPLQRRAVELFAFSLRAGGYLVIGKSESINQLGDSFAPDKAALKVFRRVGTQTQIVRSRIQDVMPSPSLKAFAPEEARIASRSRVAKRSRASDAMTPVAEEESILYGLPCGVVVVNSAYDVQYINPEARRLFGIHAMAVDQDLIHLVQRVDPIAIRGIIDRASHSGEQSNDILKSNEATGDGPQRIEITCRSMKRDKEILFALTATEVTAREQIRARLGAVEAASARMMQANEEVLAANRELTRTIQLVRDENEQLQVTNAEVQMATEEMETLNEELQASNEELETLNEELLSTIEELNTTNDDLEARSLELKGMAIAAESARHQLRGILDTVNDGIIVVNSSREIVLYSQVFNSSFGSDFDHEAFLNADGTRMDPEQTPIARAARGETFEMTFGIDGSGSPIRQYEAVGRPMSIPGSRRLGVVTVRPAAEGESAPAW